MIEFTLLEVGPPARPDAGDMNVDISVRHGDRTLRNPNVWFDRDAWASFVAQVAALIASSRGSATLVSMSPKEFRLEIHAAHDATAMAEGHIGKYGYDRSNPSDEQLPYEFRVTYEDVTRWHRLAEASTTTA